MTGRTVPLVLLSCLWFGCAPPGETPLAALPAPEPIRATKLVIGMPVYYGDSGVSATRPLIEHLSRRLGIPVHLRVAEPYSEMPKLLKNKAFDVAQLPPLAYVRLRETTPGLQPIATPIIGGSPTYLGHLYIKSEAPFVDLAELKGKRVGFVSRDSSSGYLFARDLLRRRGHDPDAFFGKAQFYRTHPQVLAAVMSGEVDVGAAFDLTSDWTGPIERPPGLRVIAKTERIPNDCLVAREGIDPGLLQALERELMRLRPGDPESERVLQTMRINGWVPASEERYDRVRRVLEDEGHTALGVP